MGEELARLGSLDDAMVVSRRDRDRHGRSREVLRRQLVRAYRPDDFFIRIPERREFEVARAFDVRDVEDALTVGPLDIDRQAEVDLFLLHYVRRAVDG